MSIMGKKGIMAGAGAGGAPVEYGEAVFTTPGSYSYTIPDGVTEISVVAVGGGANGGVHGSGFGGNGGNLAWRNSINVTPGQTIDVYVGNGGQALQSDGVRSYVSGSGISTTEAPGGYYGNPSRTNPSSTGDGGGLGGNPQSGTAPHGGGGAGGYTGNGGHNGQAGSGGGGAGGHGNEGANGGGVGLFGQGASGQPTQSPSADTGHGQGGSGGQNGIGARGGLYGGGAGGSGGSDKDGANGAVRIIWGGQPGERQFPTTNVS